MGEAVVSLARVACAIARRSRLGAVPTALSGFAVSRKSEGGGDRESLLFVVKEERLEIKLDIYEHSNCTTTSARGGAEHSDGPVAGECGFLRRGTGYSGRAGSGAEVAGRSGSPD